MFPRYLYLPLIEAERAWAYSLQLKAEANSEPRKRFHMVTRLKKSVQHTQVLLSLCESDKCDALTKLEVQVRGVSYGNNSLCLMPSTRNATVTNSLQGIVDGVSKRGISRTTSRGGS